MKQRIKTQFLSARKNKDEVVISTLSTLLGDIETKEKAGKGNLSDDQIVALVKSHLKGVIELETALTDRNLDTTETQAVKQLLTDLLPVQLSESDIQQILVTHSFQNMGLAQKFFKEHHAGRYDGSLVSKLFNAMKS